MNTNPVDLIKTDALACEWDPAPFLLFSNEVEPLVYYSHLFPTIAILILGFVAFRQNPRLLTSRIFLSISVLFALFSIFDLILWATEKPSLIMFLWSLLTYIEPLIYIATLYFVLAFARGTDVGGFSKIVACVLLLPIIILGPTSFNLAGFDYTNCWRLAVEGPLLLYVYFMEVLVVIWMLVETTSIALKKEHAKRRAQIFLLLGGAILFLLAFSSGNIFGTLLQGVMGEDAWVVGQYGFFGMPLFIAFILYLMVQHKLFQARLIYAEVILVSVFISLISLFLIPDIDTARPILGFTVVLFTLLGVLLLWGIKNDIKQREQIETLAGKLQKANNRLKELDKLKSEFVSIASHQLRSPLTSIRGYASMLAEGSFGELPEKAVEPVDRIAESSRLMALAVEDYLNVSRIESGNMKYNMADFSLKDEVEKISDDIRANAVKKGLMLLFKNQLNSAGIVNADIGKSVQIIHNLINNSLKYTPKGSITVLLRDDVKMKKIYVDIIDTGIGMSQETIDKVFEKFERADNANSVNVSGTGLGLYVAQKMAHAMGGDISAQSEGDDKGSTFTFELPLVS